MAAPTTMLDLKMWTVEKDRRSIFPCSDRAALDYSRGIKTGLQGRSPYSCHKQKRTILTRPMIRGASTWGDCQAYDPPAQVNPSWWENEGVRKVNSYKATFVTSTHYNQSSTLKWQETSEPIDSFDFLSPISLNLFKRQKEAHSNESESDDEEIQTENPSPASRRATGYGSSWDCIEGGQEMLFSR